MQRCSWNVTFLPVWSTLHCALCTVHCDLVTGSLGEMGIPWPIIESFKTIFNHLDLGFGVISSYQVVYIDTYHTESLGPRFAAPR